MAEQQPLAGKPTTLMILGASGDLTSRLLLPGLASLLEVEPGRAVSVIGVDRVELTDDQWRERVTEALTAAQAPASVIEAIATHTRYRKADLLQPDQLASLLQEADAPLVIYFALPPQVTVKVCDLLHAQELPQHTILALEKPFGHDHATARELNERLLALVPEEQIFRVDHFLGINTVLNLLGLRFSNRLLQPLWSVEHIERVDIRYDEDLTLEGRAGYYDGAGALVDMIQSHLLQIMAIFALEAPAAISAEEIRSLVAQVLRATHLWNDDPTVASRRARYTSGQIGDREVPDYVAEEGVDPDRETETLAELVLEIRNGRWKGVPFVLRSGKSLAHPEKDVVVTFRPPALVPGGLEDASAPDRLVLELKPGAVVLALSMNAEGDPFTLESKELRVELGKSRVTPYGEVLAGILEGNPLLSIRGDVAEECWRIVEPAVAAWRSGDVPLQEYPAGSTGPQGWGQVPATEPHVTIAPPPM